MTVFKSNASPHYTHMYSDVYVLVQGSVCLGQHTCVLYCTSVQYTVSHSAVCLCSHSAGRSSRPGRKGKATR